MGLGAIAVEENGQEINRRSEEAIEQEFIVSEPSPNRHMAPFRSVGREPPIDQRAARMSSLISEETMTLTTCVWS